MALLRGIVKLSDGLVFKNCPVTLRSNWNIESAFSVKKVDIPAPPKRPLSAYMIFCKENRKKILIDNPTLTSTEQIKKLAAKWSELSNDMKKPYEESARKSTLAYGEEHKLFYENLTAEQKEELEKLREEKKESRRKLKINKALRESGIPKSAPSAYALFVKSESKGKSGIQKASEFIKEIAEKWKTITPETKNHFEKEAAAEKKRVDFEMQAWKEHMVAEGKFELLKEYEESSKGRLSKRKSL